MKRLLLAGVGLAAALAQTAFAADMPPGRYMPPPRGPAYVPFFSWSGFYVGMNAGYGFGNSSWTDTGTGASTGNFSVKGALVGGTIGYNMQLGSWVFGLEGDIDWSNITGSTTSVICLGTCTTSNSWLGTARGRIGYAFDRFLPYFTGGAAFGNIKASNSPGTTSFTSAQVGWTAGGGLEYAFFANWSAKVEYLYVDLGKAGCDTVCIFASPADVTLKTNVVRAGINYKF
jgi:outer membrane immunogenic protein